MHETRLGLAWAEHVTSARGRPVNCRVAWTDLRRGLLSPGHLGDARDALDERQVLKKSSQLILRLRTGNEGSRQAPKTCLQNTAFMRVF